ncbi:hypothetical protein FSARC_14729 [Fusarium sarcochroum]|uniref:Uncharacterized protein n=1 Tax=Fusarium sarcochroum TaxID=1208366 RepID=A0A8H4SR23_9HYPO|nr:hypothetical protein FSARC_14729 [Fusarium sarcochroum]
MSDTSSDPQLQCAFITRLPREVRDGVYLELWRSCGLRQHIIWHHDRHGKTKSHFCRWQCTTSFEVQDRLQDAIDATRIELGVPLGDSFSNRTYALQLFSAWKNHFVCGQRIAEIYGSDEYPGVRACSSVGPCWRSHDPTPEDPSTWSSYSAMLLSCKIISSECLESIYESTTFIFTDTVALNMFVGFCKVPDHLQEQSKVGISPPAFRTHGRHLELALEPVFPMLLACSSPIWTPLPEERHNSLDFHGLRLDLLENLTTLDIWISSRCTVMLIDENTDNIDQSPYNVTQLDIESLREALKSLQQVKNITLSIPLAQVSDPEDGYIDDSAGLRIWRRGAGDHFHPALSPVIKVESFDKDVYSSTDRKVKLAYNPPSITHVHFAQEFNFAGGEPQLPRRGRVDRLMELMRSKGKWLNRDRKK